MRQMQRSSCECPMHQEGMLESQFWDVFAPDEFWFLTDVAPENRGVRAIVLHQLSEHGSKVSAVSQVLALSYTCQTRVRKETHKSCSHSSEVVGSPGSIEHSLAAGVKSNKLHSSLRL